MRLQQRTRAEIDYESPKIPLPHNDKWISCAPSCDRSSRGFGRTNCPPALSALKAWKPGATITVALSNFPSAIQPCVMKAFTAWNTANAAPQGPTGNQSGVTLNATFRGPIQTGINNTYQVTYSATTPNGVNMDQAGLLGATTMDNNGKNGTIGTTSIRNDITDCDTLTYATLHEIGHTMGLDECPACTDADIMFPANLPPFATTISSCDNSVVYTVTHPPPSGSCGVLCNPNGSNQKCCNSPVILDISGNGFNLTSAADGWIEFCKYSFYKAYTVAWLRLNPAL
jgi:hypothetical protein